MIVSISQPAYLPWLGYFDRIARSDLHIVLDDVQIERNTRTSFTHRNKIRTHQGWTWLTVPIRRGDTLEDKRIHDVRIDGQHWARKHWRSLSQFYGHTPYFASHKVFLEELYSRTWKILGPLLRESTDYLMRALGLDTPFRFASEMSVKGHKSDLVLSLCKNVGASHYLSGPLGRGYLDQQSFTAAGISLEFHDYVHPVYTQTHEPFMPCMSVVDLLFNHGEHSLPILRGDG